jgi:hypothetical protein
MPERPRRWYPAVQSGAVAGAAAGGNLRQYFESPRDRPDLFRQACKFAADLRSGYLPVVSTFFFSSSFIFLTVGFRLFSPVV